MKSFDTHLAVFQKEVPAALYECDDQPLTVIRGSRPWNPSYIFSIVSESEDDMLVQHRRFCALFERNQIPALVESELDLHVMDLKTSLSMPQCPLSWLESESREASRHHAGDGHWYLPANPETAKLADDLVCHGYHFIEVLNPKYPGEPYFVITVQTAATWMLEQLEGEMANHLQRFKPSPRWLSYKSEELFQFHAFGGVTPLPIVVGVKPETRPASLSHEMRHALFEA